LFHDHGSLWLENASRFGVSKNEEIEYFVDKYLTMLSNNAFKQKN
jgi:hypothetical protein